MTAYGISYRLQNPGNVKQVQSSGKKAIVYDCNMIEF